MSFKSSASILTVAARTAFATKPFSRDNALPSLQMQGIELITIEVDIEGATQCLSKAVQFPTISNQDRSDFDTKAFDDHRAYIGEAYGKPT